MPQANGHHTTVTIVQPERPKALPVITPACFIPVRKRGPKRIDRILTEAIEGHLDEVEKIIAYLDHRDSDSDLEEEPDLENGGDEEPSLAHGNDLNQTRATKHISGGINLKGGGWAQRDCDLELDNSDFEPNAGPGDDRERDDEREPEPEPGEAWHVPAVSE